MFQSDLHSNLSDLPVPLALDLWTTRKGYFWTHFLAHNRDGSDITVIRRLWVTFGKTISVIGADFHNGIRSSKVTVMAASGTSVAHTQD